VDGRTWFRGLAAIVAVTSVLAACGGDDDAAEPDRSAVVYVALGDSFSSGEGAPPYEPARGACNVSDLAWPRRLYADVAGFVSVDQRACAGAKTQHLTGPWDKRGLPAQIPDEPDDTVTLVTLTIGGNDVGFGDIVGTCVLAQCPAPDEDALAALTTTLSTSVYPALQAAYPKARLAHVGYPRLTPAPGKPIEGCDWLDEADQTRAATIITALDDAIEAATAQTDGAVEYVDVTEALAGHELCTAASWLNPIGLGAGHAHPTSAGQRGIEEAVAGGLGLDL
jgi:lysophospholipase L1-like esterase